MSLLTPIRPVEHHAHGSTFAACTAPSLGGEGLCAWRLSVPPGVTGVPHRPSREEVLLVLRGRLLVTLDEATGELAEGDVVRVPSGSSLTVSTGREPGEAWVTTTAGLSATLADGTVLHPPWAR